VTSQHIDLPLCHGTSVRPSGRFPSVWNNPECSFVTGTPAEAKERAIKSFRAWCLIIIIIIIIKILTAALLICGDWRRAVFRNHGARTTLRPSPAMRS